MSRGPQNPANTVFPNTERRSQVARENGRKGGLATVRSHTTEWLQSRASRGGATIRDLYSVDYFRHLQGLRRVRRGWPRGKLKSAVTTAERAIERSGLSGEMQRALEGMIAATR